MTKKDFMAPQVDRGNIAQAGNPGQGWGHSHVFTGPASGASAPFIGDGGFGNGVWTSPAVDVQNGKVFVTTASGVDYWDALGYSIVRLNLQERFRTRKRSISRRCA